MSTYSSSDLSTPTMGPAKRSPFQQAFAAARAAKKKDFEFPPGSGRRFSTQTAEEQGREIVAKAAAGSGRGASAGRTADDRVTGPGRAEAKGAEVDRAERQRRDDLMRPGRDAITSVMGPEMGLAGLGRAALGALGRGVTGMMTRRAAQRDAAEKAVEARREPAFDLPPQGSVFRSNRPPKDGIPTLRDAVEYKKGGTAKAYAKGGSVKGGGCETRSKKTRYV